MVVSEIVCVTVTRCCTFSGVVCLSVSLRMASADESSSSSGTQQQQQQQDQEELEPIMRLAEDMFHKTADYLNGEFDST